LDDAGGLHQLVNVYKDDDDIPYLDGLETKDGRQGRDHVAVVDLRFEAVEVADVVVVLVDVHELVQPARVVEQVAAERRIPPDECVEHLADRRPVDRNGRLTISVGAQHGGTLDLDGHTGRLQPAFFGPVAR